MLFKQNVLASYNFMCFVLIACDVFIPLLMLVIILGKIENRNSNVTFKQPVIVRNMFVLTAD